MIIRLNMKCWAPPNIQLYFKLYTLYCTTITITIIWCVFLSSAYVRTAAGENVWWRNQGILLDPSQLGVRAWWEIGSHEDNIDPSFYYCATNTNTKCVERDQKSGYYNQHTKTCGSSRTKRQ